jgi:hypothetical protein
MLHLEKNDLRGDLNMGVKSVVVGTAIVGTFAAGILGIFGIAKHNMTARSYNNIASQSKFLASVLDLGGKTADLIGDTYKHGQVIVSNASKDVSRRTSNTAETVAPYVEGGANKLGQVDQRLHKKWELADNSQNRAPATAAQVMKHHPVTPAVSKAPAQTVQLLKDYTIPGWNGVGSCKLVHDEQVPYKSFTENGNGQKFYRVDLSGKCQGMGQHVMPPGTVAPIDPGAQTPAKDTAAPGTNKSAQPSGTARVARSTSRFGAPGMV